MALDSQLTLFGLDLRKIPQFWRAGWRELLWAPNAYGRRWVDEVVTVTFSGDLKKQYYHAGEQVSPRNTKAQAYVLPESLVLETRLDLPASVELDLESMVVLEVRAKSPFPEEDTRYGWQFVRHKGGRITVDMAIVSAALIAQHLREKTHDLADAEEIWAMVEEQPIVIRGFGESARNGRYQHRMKRVIMGLLYSFTMACTLIVVLMLFKHWQLERLETQYEQVQESATEAVALRVDLAQHNVLIGNINALIENSHSPYPQLNELSTLLKDDIWLASMSIKGDMMRLVGRAGNGAALMAELSNRPEFMEVTAPTEFTRGGREQKERFVFEIKLQSKDLIMDTLSTNRGKE